jgi:hypothetical protein
MALTSFTLLAENRFSLSFFFWFLVIGIGLLSGLFVGIAKLGKLGSIVLSTTPYLSVWTLIMVFLFAMLANNEDAAGNFDRAGFFNKELWRTIIISLGLVLAAGTLTGIACAGLLKNTTFIEGS